MSVLRELVTLFTFQTEEKGLKEYNEKVKKTVETTKRLLEGIGLAIGATVALDTFMNLADKLSDSVKEAKLLRHQFDNIITPNLDPDKMLQGLYDIAQETGGLYTEVAENFKDIAISSKEFGISQVTALDATRNIAKSLEVGYLQEDQQAEVMNTLNMAFKRGILSARQFSDLFVKAPDLINTLGENIGLTNKQMRDLANSGKFTTDLLITGLAKTNEHLNEMFDAKPETLLDAWHYVYNMMVRVGTIFSKAEKQIDRISRGIKRFADVVYSAGKDIVTALGGVDAVLQLVEAAFYATFGYVTIGLILNSIRAITAMGNAAFIASGKFLLISGAVAGIVLAVDDLLTWMRGGDSITGRFLGPFEDIGEKFDKLLAPFQAIKEIFSGNIGEGWENLKKAIGDIDSKVVALGIVVGGIPALFLAWNVLKFFGLLTSIAQITAKILGIKTATKETQAELDKLKQQSEEPVAKKKRGKKGEAEPAAKGTSSIPEVSPTETTEPKQKGLVGNVAKTAQLTMTALELMNDAGLLSEEQSSRVNKMTTGATVGAAAGSFLPGGQVVGGIIGGAAGYAWDRPEFLPQWLDLTPEELVSRLLNMKSDEPLVKRDLRNLYAQQQDKPISVIPEEKPADQGKPFSGWADFAAQAGIMAGGNRPPGAIMQLPEITITPPPNDINITSNINVTVPAELSEIGNTINTQVQAGMNKVVSDITTKLNQASPRMEAATQ